MPSLHWASLRLHSSVMLPKLASNRYLESRLQRLRMFQVVVQCFAIGTSFRPDQLANLQIDPRHEQLGLHMEMPLESYLE